MNILIPAVPQRMWYVQNFMIPQLREQGYEGEQIFLDDRKLGNLEACLQAFEQLPDEGGTWHLQDDVLICRDFAERARAHDDGIVCGFGCQNFGPSMQERGRVPAVFMWYSFQCIRIPNELAGECAAWFFDDAMHRTRYARHVFERKHDDYLWREFLLERHRDLWVTNLAPNLVDHIDHLIGGTLINQQRRLQINRSAFFEDQDLVEELERRMRKR